VYALEPVIVDIVDLLGAPLTFSVGGVAVLLSGYALKKTSLDLFKANESHVMPKEKAKQSKFGLITGDSRASSAGTATANRAWDSLTHGQRANGSRSGDRLCAGSFLVPTDG
jgi:hypothetical protein